MMNMESCHCIYVGVPGYETAAAGNDKFDIFNGHSFVQGKQQRTRSKSYALVREENAITREHQQQDMSSRVFSKQSQKKRYDKSAFHPRYDKFLVERRCPSAQVVVSRLRRINTISELRNVFCEAKSVGLDQDPYLANIIITMFHKFGELQSAHEVFENLKYPTVVSWNCIITAYARSKKASEVLQLFRSMLQKGHKPNRVTFIVVIGSCCFPENLAAGKWIHAYVVKEGFKRDIAICNALITMYSKCGELKEAESLFHKMINKSSVSWNSMIAAFCNHGQAYKAILLFEKMQKQGVQPDHCTFISMLSVFRASESLCDGKEIHNCIMDHGYHNDISVCNALITMYNRCGDPDAAFGVFEQMSERDVISWTSVIDTYSRHGQGDKAIQLFQIMQRRGIKPNKVTFISVLNACANVGDSEAGKAVHSLMKKDHAVVSDLYLGNTLIHMYGKCGLLDDACAVFNEMHTKDSVSWTVMLHMYASQGHAEEALQLFEEMEKKEIKPDMSHFSIALDACSTLQALEKGKELHTCISASEFQADIKLGNSLISMYSMCGALDSASLVFADMQQHDVVSWNTIITSYAREGYIDEVLHYFSLMEKNHEVPNQLTFIGVLGAFTDNTVLDEGRRIHERICTYGFDKDAFVVNSLVSMYGKCGDLGSTASVFDSLPFVDTASWNAFITAHCHCGDSHGALKIFQRFKERLEPDEATFLSILKACTMMDTLQAGKMTHEFIQSLGFESNVAVCGALINMYGKFKSLEGACQVYDNIENHNVQSQINMIYAYLRCGQYKNATKMFTSLKENNSKPKMSDLVRLLSSCTSSDALELGKTIHFYIVEKGLEGDMFAGNALVSMYGTCDALEDAFQTFNRMHKHDVISWTTLMNIYLISLQHKMVLECYKTMQNEQILPNQVTFICLLRASKNLNCFLEVDSIHRDIIFLGYESDMYIRSTLSTICNT